MVVVLVGEVAFSANGKTAQPMGLTRVVAVDNPLYEEHCGACHFAFQPGLLPAKSWESLLDSLGDHFGDNAELPPAEAEAISNYLLDNASDQVDTALGQLILGSIPPMKTVLRITETPYFKAKHQLLESVLMDSLDKAIPYSNCIACHPGAQAGGYNEDDTQIPGMVDWKKWHLEFQ
jgi:hypothetical protein